MTFFRVAARREGRVGDIEAILIVSLERIKISDRLYQVAVNVYFAKGIFTVFSPMVFSPMVFSPVRVGGRAPSSSFHELPDFLMLQP